MITGHVIKGQRVPAQLKRAAAGLDSALARSVLELAVKMTGLVKTKLAGEVLNVRTGRLRRSVHYELDKREGYTGATVGTNVKYAAVHEKGLTIPPHIVEARRAKVLAFNVGGKTAFAKRVRIPAVKMPRRSFLDASLRQMEPEIRETLAATAGRHLRAVLTEGVK